MTEVFTTRRPQYEFIDGLRAMAALSVAVYHAFLFSGLQGQTVSSYGLLGRFVLNGRFAVAVFIVLSGFVLMLPVARHEDLRVRGGAREFFRRRARRILPPYYAALALFLVLIVAVPAFQDARGTQWAGKVPVTPGGVLSHVFLVHNLRGAWHDQVDGPMWSVATEFQIYVLMPFVLLPLWRRFGGWAVTAVAVLLGLAVHLLLPGLDGAHVWYVGLFAAGMLAATAHVRGWRLRGARPVALVSTAVLAVVLVAGQYRLRPQDWLTETAVGLVFALGLFVLAQRRSAAATGRVLALLESAPLVKVGLFSYSIYLFHSPLIGLSNVLLMGVDLPLAVRLATMVLVVTPSAVGVSYLAHLAVERRFMTQHQSQVQASPVMSR